MTPLPQPRPVAASRRASRPSPAGPRASTRPGRPCRARRWRCSSRTGAEGLGGDSGAERDLGIALNEDVLVSAEFGGLAFHEVDVDPGVAHHGPGDVPD